MDEQVCQQCGQCCTRYAFCIFAESEDIQRWIINDRYDILKHFKYMGDAYVWCDKLWEAYILCEPEVVKEEITSFADLLTPSHNEYNICPFRRKMKDGKYKCSIHDTKPTVCKNFTPWKPGWATDENGNSHDVSPTSYTWCEAMIQKRNGK